MAVGWLLLPIALVLGVLHGLEPGHSKTMMTAFIIAIRGTVAQAVLLGFAATVSHTSVVSVVALIGIHFASQYYVAVVGSYFQIVSSLLIIAIAMSMLRRTWRGRRRVRAATRQHAHCHKHGQNHPHPDTHQLVHIDDIRRRLVARDVTTGQVVLFGLSGGLIPCSAAIAVLVLCLQVKQIWLGVALVWSFSIGLPITLIAAGSIAALGMRLLSQRWSAFGQLAQRAPYLSGIVMIGVGVYVSWQGWMTVPSPL